MHELRTRLAQMGGQMPVVRTMEYLCGASGEKGIACGPTWSSICTVSSATEGITASGTGKYVKDGEKLAWGNKDRDGIYLDYTVNFGEKQFAVRDTLVSRSREIKIETYVPTYKE